MIEQFVLPVYRLIIEYSYLFLAILLIVKLFQLMSSFRNGGEGSSPWDPWGNKDGDGDGSGRDGGGSGRSSSPSSSSSSGSRSPSRRSPPSVTPPSVGRGASLWSLSPACRILDPVGSVIGNFSVKNNGDLVDGRGKRLSLNIGDTLHFVADSRGSETFNASSHTSHVKFIKNGHTVHVHMLNPLGTYLNSTYTQATFDVVIPGTILAGNYKVSIRLEML